MIIVPCGRALWTLPLAPGCFSIGELELEGVGLFLDLRREGRREHAAVPGGNQALGLVLRLGHELRRDPAMLSPLGDLFEIGLGLVGRVLLGGNGDLVLAGTRAVTASTGRKFVGAILNDRCHRCRRCHIQLLGLGFTP